MWFFPPLVKRASHRLLKARLWRDGFSLGDAVVGHDVHRSLEVIFWRDGFSLEDTVVWVQGSRTTGGQILMV